MANDGFWGIPIGPNTTYKATFYAKATPGFTGLTLAIVGNQSSVRAATEVSGLTQDWKKFEASLTTGDIAVSADNQFVLLAGKPGTT